MVKRWSRCGLVTLLGGVLSGHAMGSAGTGVSAGGRVAGGGLGRLASSAVEIVGGAMDDAEKEAANRERLSRFLSSGVFVLSRSGAEGSSVLVSGRGQTSLCHGRYEAYNSLHSLANTYKKPFDVPAVVVIGAQSAGKSALVEALMGFQRDGGAALRSFGGAVGRGG